MLAYYKAHTYIYKNNLGTVYVSYVDRFYCIKNQVMVQSWGTSIEKYIEVFKK